MLVVYGDLFSFHNLRFQPCKAFLVAETVIGFPFFNQFSGIFQINAGLLPLRLYVRPDAPVFVRPFIVDKPGLFQRPVDNIHSPFHKPFLISILNTENKISALMLGDQVGIFPTCILPVGLGANLVLIFVIYGYSFLVLLLSSGLPGLKEKFIR